MNVRSSITPCIFGTTNGFEIQTLTKVPLNIDSLSFGVTQSEVELSSRDECVKVFRVRIKSEIYTWIGLYRKAYEIGFSREGGYYGAGLWLAGITIQTRIALDVLKDLADQVNRLALSEGQFQRPLSAIADEMHAPASLGPLRDSSARYLRGGLSPEAMPTAYVPIYGSPRETVDWAQTTVFAEKFRAVIIGPEGGFPKAPSSRLEHFASLTDVYRILQDDAAQYLDKLREENFALQKQAADLGSELEKERQRSRAIQTELTRYKTQMDRYPLQFSQPVRLQGSEWNDWFIIIAGIVAVISLLVFGYIGWQTEMFGLLKADKATQDEGRVLERSVMPAPEASVVPGSTGAPAPEVPVAPGPVNKENDG